MFIFEVVFFIFCFVKYLFGAIYDRIWSYTYASLQISDVYHRPYDSWLDAVGSTLCRTLEPRKFRNSICSFGSCRLTSNLDCLCIWGWCCSCSVSWDIYLVRYLIASGRALTHLSKRQIAINDLSIIGSLLKKNRSDSLSSSCIITLFCLLGGMVQTPPLPFIFDSMISFRVKP